MFLANGNIVLDQPVVGNASAYVSSHSNVTLWTNFIGEILATDNITIEATGALKYDNSVLADSYFTLPAGMTE